MAKSKTAHGNPPAQCLAVEDSLTIFVALFSLQLQMCDELEHVADSLPNQVDEKQCRWLATNLMGLLTSAHTVEESVIFPRLVRQDTPYQLTEELVDRLCAEHCMDRGYGEEVCELLLVLCEDTGVCDMNSAGYALRGFFESVRRHVHFDLTHVLPLAQGQLKDDDLRQIASLLQDNQFLLVESISQTELSLRNRTPQ